MFRDRDAVAIPASPATGNDDSARLDDGITCTLCGTVVLASARAASEHDNSTKAHNSGPAPHRGDSRTPDQQGPAQRAAPVTRVSYKYGK